MKKLLILAFLVITSRATGQIYPTAADGTSFSGDLVNETGLAYSKNFTLDLSAYNAKTVSAQVIYGSATIPAATFYDGAQSTGSITVVNYANLSSAAATSHITILTNKLAANAAITIVDPRLNIITLTQGVDWFLGASTHATAVSLASAISGNTSLSVVASGAIVYSTAPAGASGNAYQFTSNTSSMAVSAAYMNGGQDPAVLTIGSTALTAGKQWLAGTSNAQTATNIATAINAATALKLKAAAIGAIVTATSTVCGTAYNYPLASSTATYLSVFKSTMVNGTNPGLTLNGHVFASAARNSMTLGLPVLYAAGQTPAIGGLTGGTTYYVTPLGATYFELATYSTSAIAGYSVSNSSDFVTVTSTNTQLYTSMDTYTLTPIAFNGTASFVWQSSNDGSSYITAPSTASVSIITTGPATANIDFGVYNYRYLRFSYTKPTWGASAITVPVNIKQDPYRSY
jgi:hypothetical protein